MSCVDLLAFFGLVFDLIFRLFGGIFGSFGHQMATKDRLKQFLSCFGQYLVNLDDFYVGFHSD